MGRDGLHPHAQITMAAGYWWDRLDGLGEVGGKEEQKREVLHAREAQDGGREEACPRMYPTCAKKGAERGRRTHLSLIEKPAAPTTLLSFVLSGWYPRSPGLRAW